MSSTTSASSTPFPLAPGSWPPCPGRSRSATPPDRAVGRWNSGRRCSSPAARPGLQAPEPLRPSAGARLARASTIREVAPGKAAARRPRGLRLHGPGDQGARRRRRGEEAPARGAFSPAGGRSSRRRMRPPRGARARAPSSAHDAVDDEPIRAVQRVRCCSSKRRPHRAPPGSCCRGGVRCEPGARRRRRSRSEGSGRAAPVAWCVDGRSTKTRVGFAMRSSWNGTSESRLIAIRTASRSTRRRID